MSSYSFNCEETLKIHRLQQLYEANGVRGNNLYSLIMDNFDELCTLDEEMMDELDLIRETVNDGLVEGAWLAHMNTIKEYMEYVLDIIGDSLDTKEIVRPQLVPN